MKYDFSVRSEENRQLSRYPYRIRAAVLESMTEYLPDCRRIVFLGDSLTDYGQWHEILEMKNVAIYNRGISGDTINGVLARLDTVERLRPHMIFLMIGINNLSMGQTVKDAAWDYKCLVDVMKQKFHPTSTKILLLSVLPINEDACRNPYLRGNDDIVELNREICALCHERKNMSYVDIYSFMLDEKGQMHFRYTIDGVHLNSDGYAIWASCIRNLI